MWGTPILLSQIQLFYIRVMYSTINLQTSLIRSIVHRFCALFTFYCWRRDGKIPLFHCILSVTRGKVLSSVGFPEKTLPAERSIRCYRKFCSALSRFRGIGRSDDFSRVYYFSIGSFNPGARSTPIKDREPRGALETRSSFPGLKQNGFLPIIP